MLRSYFCQLEISENHSRCDSKCISIFHMQVFFLPPATGGADNDQDLAEGEGEFNPFLACCSGKENLGSESA